VDIGAGNSTACKLANENQHIPQTDKTLTASIRGVRKMCFDRICISSAKGLLLFNYQNHAVQFATQCRLAVPAFN
jgi:hypothetical protein